MMKLTCPECGGDKFSGMLDTTGLGSNLTCDACTRRENELLCEKLLGWVPSEIHTRFWHTPDGRVVRELPTFLTGDGMLLLIEALQKIPSTLAINEMEYQLGRRRLTPAVVRKAALDHLAYIKMIAEFG